MMHARMQNSYRKVTDPEQADLFLIPLAAYDTCYARPGVSEEDRNCDRSYSDYRFVKNVWRWLAEQPSFQRSDGSDHFVFAEFPLPYLDHKVRSVRGLHVSWRKAVVGWPYLGLSTPCLTCQAPCSVLVHLICTVTRLVSRSYMLVDHLAPDCGLRMTCC